MTFLMSPSAYEIHSFLFCNYLHPLLYYLRYQLPPATFTSLSPLICVTNSPKYFHASYFSLSAFLIWLCSNRLHHSPFFASSNPQPFNSSIFIGLSQSSCNHSALSRSVFTFIRLSAFKIQFVFHTDSDLLRSIFSLRDFRSYFQDTL